jgi:hypothetical protein
VQSAYQMLGFNPHHRPINSATHIDILLRDKKKNLDFLDLKIHDCTSWDMKNSASQSNLGRRKEPFEPTTQPLVLKASCGEDPTTRRLAAHRTIKSQRLPSLRAKPRNILEQHPAPAVSPIKLASPPRSILLSKP